MKRERVNHNRRKAFSNCGGSETAHGLRRSWAGSRMRDSYKIGLGCCPRYQLGSDHDRLHQDSALESAQTQNYPSAALLGCRSYRAGILAVH